MTVLTFADKNSFVRNTFIVSVFILFAFLKTISKSKSSQIYKAERDRKGKKLTLEIQKHSFIISDLSQKKSLSYSLYTGWSNTIRK